MPTNSKSKDYLSDVNLPKCYKCGFTSIALTLLAGLIKDETIVKCPSCENNIKLILK